MKPTHGSLFSGIGGFDLAAEWMGWDNKFHCEWNEFGQKVLKHYWPKAESYADITTTDFSIWRGKIDILTGGFPCQPYSSAGKRLGKEDDRHLWPEMLRAIGEISPRYVVGENVRGLTNWNGGLVFDEVQAELEAKGYEVTPFLLPACAVNAPHRRDRIWFIAHSDMRTAGSPGESGEVESNRCQNNDEQSSGGVERQQHTGCSELLRVVADTRLLGQEKCEKQTAGIKQCDKGNATNTNSIERSERRMHAAGNVQRNFISSRDAQSDEPGAWHNFPTQSPICNGDDGISSRLDGITFPKWRNESIKAGGNAIVPQVAHQIFKAIEQYETLISEK